MRGGFSFCNVDIADLGLEYAPEINNTYVYNFAETAIHEEIYDGHNGGYYYGSSRKPKEFVLRCFFEEKDIRKGIITKVNNLFRVGRSGKLIFQKRPWVYYIATVTSVPELSPTNYLNGIITLKLKSYYPFARSESDWCPTKKSEDRHINWNGRTDLYHGDVMLNSAFPDADIFPSCEFTFADNAAVTAAKPILLNPGTERAPVGIAVSGKAKSIAIKNLTNGLQCKLLEINKDITTDINKVLFVDSINGKVVLKDKDENNNSNPILAFLHHDYGYLELEPNYPAIRNIYISYTNGSNTINTTNIIRDDIKDKYIYINDWYKIENYNNKEITLTKPVNITEESYGTQHTRKTMIVSMNELQLTPVGEIEDLHIKFIYNATFS